MSSVEGTKSVLRALQRHSLHQRARQVPSCKRAQQKRSTEGRDVNTATFFITTARSGTQWVTRSLRETYPDLLSVEHEPIKYAYAPKRCLRNPSELAALRAVPIVRSHFDHVHRILATRS